MLTKTTLFFKFSPPFYNEQMKGLHETLPWLKRKMRLSPAILTSFRPRLSFTDLFNKMFYKEVFKESVILLNPFMEGFFRMPSNELIYDLETC
jgi:hypothetical protein